MSAVLVINCRGQSIPVKRSTLGEGHLIDNTAFKYSLKHTFPFVPQAYVYQTGNH